MGFDIRKLDTKAASEKGLTFDVMWDGQEIGVKISVVGAESAVFKKHKAIVDGKANLFNFTGVTAGSGNLIDTTITTHTAYGGIPVYINGVGVRYLALVSA